MRRQGVKGLYASQHRAGRLRIGSKLTRFASAQTHVCGRCYLRYMETLKTFMESADAFKTVSCSTRANRIAASNETDPSRLLMQEMRKNDQFVDLLNAFRPSGGLARVAEVAARFQTHDVHEVSPLAGWIKTREVISFEWQSRLWLPLFQFNPASLTTGLSEALAELPEAFDDWDTAIWFASPNPLLAHSTPADMLATSAAHVRDAAHAERYIPINKQKMLF